MLNEKVFRIMVDKYKRLQKNTCTDTWSEERQRNHNESIKNSGKKTGPASTVIVHNSLKKICSSRETF